MKNVSMLLSFVPIAMKYKVSFFFIQYDSTYDFQRSGQLEFCCR